MRWLIMFLAFNVLACSKTSQRVSIENRLEFPGSPAPTLQSNMTAVVMVWYGWEHPTQPRVIWHPVVGIVSARGTVFTSFPPFKLAWLEPGELSPPSRIYVTPINAVAADAKEHRWAGTFNGWSDAIATVSVPELPHTPIVWSDQAPEKRVGKYVLALDGKGLVSDRSETWPPQLSASSIAYQHDIEYGDRSCVIGIRYHGEPKGEAFAAFDERHELIGLIDGRVVIVPEHKHRNPSIPPGTEWGAWRSFVCIAIP